ncbi:MAG: hypothetical protein LBE10_12170, partial [Treponema sp.]|nr:hypothetical protein [Treponema sp.]
PPPPPRCISGNSPYINTHYQAVYPPFTAGEIIRVDEPVPKLIDCALTYTVLDRALAVSQAFSLAKLRILRLLFQNFSFGTASDNSLIYRHESVKINSQGGT